MTEPSIHHPVDTKAEKGVDPTTACTILATATAGPATELPGYVETAFTLLGPPWGGPPMRAASAEGFAPCSPISLTAQADALEWADAQLGMLFDYLVDRQPLVVVCADHGEEFGEEGRFGHGHARRGARLPSRTGHGPSKAGLGVGVDAERGEVFDSR